MDVYVLVLQLFLQRLVEKKTQPYSMGFTASLKEVPGAKGREGGGGGERLLSLSLGHFQSRQTQESPPCHHHHFPHHMPSDPDYCL